MRPIWSGNISFVLINIPVRLYPAVQGKSFEFHLLHKKDMSRVRYARYCEIENKEIPYEDIVKGYEYEKDQFVIIEPEDFAKADPKRFKTIEIFDFAAAKDIDPIYYDHPYYLEPEEGAEKTYSLLKQALNTSDKVAIAKFVLRDREHLAAIRPESDYLLLQQLRFSHEIKSNEDLKKPNFEPEAKELDLALSLIEKLSGKFNPSEYKDDYFETMQKIIDTKAKGQLVKPLSAEPKATEFEDLMAKLKESLEKTSTK